MAGTKEGAAKARETILARHGNDYFKNLGYTGGKTTSSNTHKRGFGSDKELAKKMGKLASMKRWAQKDDK